MDASLGVHIGVGRKGRDTATVIPSIPAPLELSSDSSGGGPHLGDAR